MDEEAVFKRYDIRGEYGEEIDKEFAEILGKAIGTLAQRKYSGELTVCKDNKTSSAVLKEKLIEGILSTGTDIYDAGTGPTDYAAMTGRRFRSPTVQVTSSHLPLNSNGFKLMYPEGNGFENHDLDKVEELFKRRDFESGEGNLARAEKASKGFYRKKAVSFTEAFSNKQEDRKAVLETMGGAARELLPKLLEETGLEVIDLSRGKPEGPYFDPPEPLPERLGHVEEKVEEEDAFLGLATDMDADRLKAYYDGSWLTGDQLFSIFVKMLDSPKVVASIDTAGYVEEVVNSEGGEIHYTRVGDPFVISRTLEVDADLAGEPNGHYCFPEFVPYNSGILSALLLARTDLEGLIDELPEYFTAEADIEVDDKDSVLEKFVERARIEFDVLSEIDGVKYIDEDSTVLVRSSGSSQIIRLKSGSREEESAEKALNNAKELIRNQ